LLAGASIEVNACSHSIVHPAVLKVQGLGGVVYFSVSKYRSFLFIEDVKGVVIEIYISIYSHESNNASKEENWLCDQTILSSRVVQLQKLEQITM